jgi:hypothetical protein
MTPHNKQAELVAALAELQEIMAELEAMGDFEHQIPGMEHVQVWDLRREIAARMTQQTWLGRPLPQWGVKPTYLNPYSGH